MEIKVLGPGCHKCTTLEKSLRAVLEETGIKADVIKITDLKEIAASGVLLTPGLIINGQIKSMGKALNKAEIKKILQQEVQ